MTDEARDTSHPGVGLGLCLRSAHAYAATCDSLARLTLDNTKITVAQEVAAGASRRPGPARQGGAATQPRAFATLPAFCRVAATLTPSSDSDIKIEVWLPAARWNGKFQAVGNGGWAGTISYAALAAAVAAATRRPAPTPVTSATAAPSRSAIRRR